MVIRANVKVKVINLFCRQHQKQQFYTKKKYQRMNCEKVTKFSERKSILFVVVEKRS